MTIGPGLDVLVPSYNDGKRTGYIRECISSVAAQSYAGWNCLVSDNSSPLPFVEAAGDLLDDRFHVVRQTTNLGLWGNWEFLLRTSRAPFVAILADDDMWQPEMLARCIAALVASPDSAMAVCLVDFLLADGKVESFSPPYGSLLFTRGDVLSTPVHVSPAVVCASQVFRHSVPSSAFVARRERLLAALPLDRGFPFADGLAWPRACAQGGLVHVPYRGLTYRFHGGTATSSGWIDELSLPIMSRESVRLLEEMGRLSPELLLAVGKDERFPAWQNALHALYLRGTRASRAVGRALLKARPRGLAATPSLLREGPGRCIEQIGLRIAGLRYFGLPRRSLSMARRIRRGLFRRHSGPGNP